jgi:hypothetical protein
MEIGDAIKYVLGKSANDVGRFYSSGEQVSIGRGKLYSSVIYPIFDSDSGVFLTVFEPNNKCAS